MPTAAPTNPQILGVEVDGLWTFSFENEISPIFTTNQFSGGFRTRIRNFFILNGGNAEFKAAHPQFTGSGVATGSVTDPPFESVRYIQPDVSYAIEVRLAFEFAVAVGDSRPTPAELATTLSSSSFDYSLLIDLINGSLGDIDPSQRRFANAVCNDVSFTAV